MALVVFLRGINVGGRRSFRPKVLTDALRQYDVINIGAAGTFVVRRPGLRADFLRVLREALPFPAKMAVCRAQDIARFVKQDPFGGTPDAPGLIRFVSVLEERARRGPPAPFNIPEAGPCFVRVFGCLYGRFIYGVYRRQMKSIGYLGQLDQLFGAAATTRSWSTIATVAERIGQDLRAP